MITTGSKFYFGLAGVGILAAILYGIITNGADQGGVVHLLSGNGAIGALVGPLTLGYKGGVGDHVGYTVLMGFGLSAGAMGVVCSFFRDGEREVVVSVDEQSVTTTDFASMAADGPSFWPVATGVGVTLMTLGLATGAVLFVLGIIVLVVSAIMWTVEAWAARATGDPAVNREIRNRFIRPLELPVAALLIAGLVIFSISRLLLSLSKNGSWIAALLFGALFFGTAILLSAKPQLKRGVVAAVVVIGFALIIGVGIYGAVKGERFTNDSHSGQTPAGEPGG